MNFQSKPRTFSVYPRVSIASVRLRGQRQSWEFLAFSQTDPCLSWEFLSVSGGSMSLLGLPGVSSDGSMTFRGTPRNLSTKSMTVLHAKHNIPGNSSVSIHKKLEIQHFVAVNVPKILGIPAFLKDAAFLLTVGSFLLTVELFLLTVDNFSFLTYNWSFFAYSGKVRLIRALRHCNQRSLTVSKKAPTVSEKLPPFLNVRNPNHKAGKKACTLTTIVGLQRTFQPGGRYKKPTTTKESKHSPQLFSASFLSER